MVVCAVLAWRNSKFSDKDSGKTLCGLKLPKGLLCILRKVCKAENRHMLCERRGWTHGGKMRNGEA